MKVRTPLKYHEEKKHEDWMQTWTIWLVCVMNLNGKMEWIPDVVPTRNDVWPRCDECNYKPGVRTVWSITKKWNMNNFQHRLILCFQITFCKYILNVLNYLLWMQIWFYWIDPGDTWARDFTAKVTGTANDCLTHQVKGVPIMNMNINGILNC